MVKIDFSISIKSNHYCNGRTNQNATISNWTIPSRSDNVVYLQFEFDSQYEQFDIHDAATTKSIVWFLCGFAMRMQKNLFLF